MAWSENKLSGFISGENKNEKLDFQIKCMHGVAGWPQISKSAVCSVQINKVTFQWSGLEEVSDTAVFFH